MGDEKFMSEVRKRTTATLLKCFECGRNVSSHASHCPHCTSGYPSGVKCSVCCQVLRRSEALKVSKEYGGAENRVSVKFFHRTCHEQVSQLRVGRSRTSCPVCHTSIEFDTSSSLTCKSCGQRFQTHFKDPSYANCCYCGFRLNKNLEVEVKQVNRQFLDGWVTEPVYGHRVCYTKERQAEEKKLQNKEQVDQKQVSKKLAEMRHQKRVAKNKETLALSLVLGLTAGIILGGLGGLGFHFIWGFGYSWKSAGLWGFSCVFILTVVGVWISSFFE